MSFNDLYIPCMQCKLPCAGIINRNTNAAVDSRHVPRGFYSAAEPGMRPVAMFISTNPGGGGESWLESPEAYGQPTTTEVVNFQRGFIQGLFQRPPRQFHRTLKIMAQAYLGMEWPKFAHHAVFTDLVKCTTPNDALVPPDTKLTCATHHLSRELNAWNPVVLIALGNEAARWLVGPGAAFYGNRPLLQLPHPSAKGKGINHEWFRTRAAALREQLNPDHLLQ